MEKPLVVLKHNISKAIEAIEKGRVSERYRPVDSEIVMDKMHEIFTKQGLSYTTRTVYPKSSKNTTHWLEYTLQNSNVTINGDTITPRLLLRNSYQGESSLRIMVGFLRLACSNGLIIGNSFLNERIIHVKGETGDNRLAELPLKVTKTLDYIFNAFKTDLEAATQKDVSVNVGDQIIDALELSKRLTERAKQAWHTPCRVEDSFRNVWTLWNIINEQVSLSSRSDFRINENNVHLLSNIITQYNKLAG